MPSRHAPPPTSQSPPQLLTGATISAAFSLLLLFTLCLRKRKPSTTTPSAVAATRYSLSTLRRATNNFSPSLRLGQGGFGSVYLAHPPSPSPPLAVKVMDSGSLQGEREFHNELFFASKIATSPFIIHLLGFASDRKKRRMMIVYELMSNGSLQDCLFHKKSVELRDWGKRFSVGVGIGKGIEYLHHYCDPPIIHGDIKPSNVLLDEGFNPRISDFGLARLKEEVKIDIEVGKEEKISDFEVGRNGVVVDRFEEGESPGSIRREGDKGCVVDGLDEGFTRKISDFGRVGIEGRRNGVVVDRFEEGESPASVLRDKPSEVRIGTEGRVVDGLDKGFNGKIRDFGVKGMKEEVGIEVEVKNEEGRGVVEESPESVLRFETSPETLNGAELSPEGCVVSPRAVSDRVSPEGVDKMSVSEANFDGFSVESGRAIGIGSGGGKKGKKKKKSVSGKDWWWKQDNGGGGQSGPVKDYVMEWLGNEIKKERPKSDFAGTSSNTGVGSKSEKKKKPRRRLEWWVSMDEDKKLKKDKRRPAREWWKEEYCEELAREKKKKRKQLKGYMSEDQYSDNWRPRDEIHADRRNRSRSRGSRGSMDWWLEGVSGELWRRRTSHDSVSGDVPRSGGMSSTPSMRGTVCYIAPEYGGGGDLSEKCDVYSYGVLLLVLIAGRRPLQVTGSPMSEFQRANLLSWTRHLARRGKLLELVDPSIESYDKEQVLLCIKVALLCLQKSPTSRPSMKEVVKYLSGELELPQLPFEFSPSPASRASLKSHRKARNLAS